jgi:hypothetical protein
MTWIQNDGLKEGAECQHGRRWEKSDVQSLQQAAEACENGV